MLGNRIVQYFHVAFLLSALVLLVAYFDTQAQLKKGPLVLETEHLATLPPHQHESEDSASDTSHHYTVNSTVLVAPRDFYISQIDFEMLNAPNETLHHASLIDLSNNNATCKNFPGWRELFVYGSDRMYENSLRLPEGYALLIKKGTPLLLTLMVHNPEPPVGPGELYQDVFTRMTLRETSADPDTLSLVEPYLLHIDDIPCGYTEPDTSDVYTFTIPPHTKNGVFNGRGSDDIASSRVFEKPATIVHMAGHLHGWQGGKKLLLRKNEEVVHVFQSTISTTSPFLYEVRHSSSPLHLNAGDRLSISAIYDNPHSTSTRGAMGIVGFYYTEDIR